MVRHQITAGVLDEALITAGVLDEALMGYRLEKPKHCPQDVYDVMWKCWNSKSEERPAFTTLYSDLRRMSNDKDDYTDVMDER